MQQIFYTIRGTKSNQFNYIKFCNVPICLIIIDEGEKKKKKKNCTLIII